MKTIVYDKDGFEKSISNAEYNNAVNDCKLANLYAQNAYDVAINKGYKPGVATEKAREAFELAQKRISWGLNVWTGIADKTA